MSSNTESPLYTVVVNVELKMGDFSSLDNIHSTVHGAFIGLIAPRRLITKGVIRGGKVLNRKEIYMQTSASPEWIQKRLENMPSIEKAVAKYDPRELTESAMKELVQGHIYIR